MQGANSFKAMLDRDNLMHFEVSASSVTEAKIARKQAVVQQKRINFTKRQLNLEMKQIRAQYQQKSRSAGRGGSNLLSLMLKPGLAGKYRAAAKSDLRAKRDSVLQPYEHIKTMIEDALTQLDSVKLQIDKYIESERDNGT